MADAIQSDRTSQKGAGLAGLVDNAQRLASGLGAEAQQAATEAAQRLAEQQKAAIAERVDVAAEVLDTTAGAIEKLVPQAAPYMRDTAATVHNVSSTLREQSIEDLMQMVLRFARAEPITFAGGAVLVGFGLARFLKSTADRRAMNDRATQPRR
jgi:ABC-type transporter Mla subunit MlaD